MGEYVKVILIILALAVILALLAYLRWIRPWQLRWGATNAELERTMPGDDLLKRPTFNATRAVTIRARPEEIWPWIVQLGYGRAGWYSYDWIDNLGRPSAESIISELQQRDVGDLIPMGPGQFGLQVKALESNRSMLWGNKGDRNQATWAWGLYPLDETQTRLVSRVRIRYDWTRPSIIFHLLLDVGDIVMMRKCMLGIKRRAEAGAGLTQQFSHSASESEAIEASERDLQ